MRLVVKVGLTDGPAAAELNWAFSFDASATRAPTLTPVTLDEANQTP
jgi:hypothetical protein